MDFIFSVRGRNGDHYSNKIGAAKYLAVSGDSSSLAKSQECRKSDWYDQVLSAARNAAPAHEKGHIVVFVHGFNTAQYDMLERHRKIKDGLAEQGFPGVVVSFDWPSDGHVLGYASDRADARRSAELLFAHGITRFSSMQRPDCEVNLHILAHSMGTFLVREAFDYADDDHRTASNSWTVSQTVFVAADVSSKSMEQGSAKTSSLFRRNTRVTNYYSPYDEVLSISEVKRLGVARRLGRVGLPEASPEKAVNLYCGAHFDTHRKTYLGKGEMPSISHSWYFESAAFYADLSHTFLGKLDRDVIPTRRWTDRGNLALI